MKKLALLASVVFIGALGCTKDNQTVSPTPSTSSTRSTPSDTARNIPTTGTPAMTDADHALAQRIQDVWRQDSTLASSAPNVQVYVNNGEVTLRGSVNSQEEKTNFGMKAQQVAGVTRVNNNLEVSNASR